MVLKGPIPRLNNRNEILIGIMLIIVISYKKMQYIFSICFYEVNGFFNNDIIISANV